jgi:methyltransferase (TIGR00027 family)
MAQTGVSRSAQNVALVRTHLTWLGVVNDPYARQMLTPDRRRTAAALRLPGLRRLRLPGLAGLAARTLFFDSFVNEALDDGVRQVVIVGAGYDSRAWRLARPGVTFFEIEDRPPRTTSARRPPQGGPVYIPADVTDPQPDAKLREAGFRADEPTAFSLEGLTAYLAEEDVAALFARLADLAPTGSALAVSFDNGFERQRSFSRFARAYYKRAREPWRFRLQSEDAASFLAESGWTMQSLVNLSDLANEHLTRTELAGTLNTTSFVVVARKRVRATTSHR